MKLVPPPPCRMQGKPASRSTLPEAGGSTRGAGMLWTGNSWDGSRPAGPAVDRVRADTMCSVGLGASVSAMSTGSTELIGVDQVEPSVLITLTAARTILPQK